MLGAPDDNFEEFVSNWDLFKDRIVVFLGAGASVGAKNSSGEWLPNAYELRNRLWEHFKHDKSKPFDPAELKLMSLEHAASIIEAKIGRDELAKYLSSAFKCEKPLWSHIALPHLSPRSVFTTNYDELVELGYKQHDALYDVICDDRMPTSGRVPLYKPHGSLSHSNQLVGHGGLVITQFDYFDMISKYRNMLKKTITGFGQTCVVVIGYSFGDMDIGSELYELRRQNAGTPWYTIFPRADPLVRRMYTNRLKIEQINRTFEDFLADLDDRVNFLPSHAKYLMKDQLRREGRIQ